MEIRKIDPKECMQKRGGETDRQWTDKTIDWVRERERERERERDKTGPSQQDGA